MAHSFFPFPARCGPTLDIVDTGASVVASADRLLRTLNGHLHVAASHGGPLPAGLYGYLVQKACTRSATNV